MGYNNHTDQFYAQVAANESNERIARQNNEWNWAIARDQNDWNIAQWKRENDYNSPKQQVQRYLEAGINPLWAMQSGDAGQAQHLTAAAQAPASEWTFQPEYDPLNPQRIGNIISASQNVMNNAFEFWNKFLEQEDVKTRQRSQASLERLQNADIVFRKAQTEGQSIFNNLNSETYQTQVMMKVRELDDLNQSIALKKKQGENIDKDIQLKDENIKQIAAQTDYIYFQKDRDIDLLKQGWRKLAIELQNANTSVMNANISWYSAQSQSYYHGEDLKQRYREYGFNKSLSEFDLKLRSNQQLLQLYDTQRGYLGKVLGGLGDTVNEALGSDVPSRVQQSFDVISDIGTVLKSRVIDDPSPENIQSFNEWQSKIGDLPEPAPLPYPMANGRSVLNWSSPWQ